MSEITLSRVWYPPEFPEQGRLPSDADLISQNYAKQESLERAYHNALCLAANRRVAPPCCKTLHISLFFDGTGNNLNHDLYQAVPPHPTNIARLFRATIGQGYAAGLGNLNEALTDLPDSGGNRFYKYYIPGVGTPCPEIMDLDFSLTGLAFAAHGEDRINWGLLRIIDALRRTLDLPLQTNGQTWNSIKAMKDTNIMPAMSGHWTRQEVFERQLKQPDLYDRLRVALNPAEPGKIRLLGIKLYVYGFSRGAAAARAFVNWLSELFLEPFAGVEKPEQCLRVGDLKIPLSIEFLGLLDTVASVGVPHMAPVAEGHMGWADGNQELPAEETYGGLIKRCVHLVSSHEQRLCFPLDSIRRTDGTYPAHSLEVIYPGMHSDIGGGYPPGDQGKANGKDDSLLLSQIALHELYAAAFAAGAPLKVSRDALPEDLRREAWRVLPEDVEKEYNITPQLAARFNAWRALTLNLPPSAESISAKEATTYQPIQAADTLEAALEAQLGWLTAWRIHRYANGTCQTHRFFIDAAADGLDRHRDPAIRQADEAARESRQDDIERTRQQLLASAPPKQFVLLTPGEKDFDAALGQTQLRQAAVEFRQDYLGLARDHTQTWKVEPLYALKSTMFLLNTDDEYSEWLRMKTAGESRLRVLFPAAGEASNAAQPGGLVRALFDDQVHDSRAWFMHSALGAREPWGSYFRYRMVYFGERCSKPISPLMVAGVVVGAATLVGGITFIIKQKKVPQAVLGAAGMLGALTLEVEAIEVLSGQPVPLLPEAAQLQAFTQQPGAVVIQQKEAISDLLLARAKQVIRAICNTSQAS